MCAPLSPTPVSYTHLDVYKRQLDISEEDANNWFNDKSATELSVSQLVEAVSYTHLDVYKRQAEYCKAQLDCTPHRKCSAPRAGCP